MDIKFRLIEKGKVVGYERWNSIAGKWCYDIKPDGVFSIDNPFIPHTDKEQFTTKLDKHGREVYIGDKVQWHTWDGYEGETVVKLRNGRFYPVADGCLEYQRYDEERGVEISGNIREGFKKDGESMKLRGELPSLLNRRLTPRQLDIMKLVSEGCLISEIAQALGIAVSTVKNHKQYIFDKLEARTSAHAVAILKDRGLIQEVKNHVG